MNTPQDPSRVPWWVVLLLLATYFIPLAGAFAFLGHSRLVGVLWWALGWPHHVDRPIPMPLLESIIAGMAMALWFVFVIPDPSVARREAT